MQKIAFQTTVLTGLLMGFLLLVGCSDDNANPTGPSNPLIGAWNMTEAKLTYIPAMPPLILTPNDTVNFKIDLDSDSTFDMQFTYGSIGGADSGRWIYNDSVITLTGSSTIQAAYIWDKGALVVSMILPWLGNVPAILTMRKE